MKIGVGDPRRWRAVVALASVVAGSLVMGRPDAARAAAQGAPDGVSVVTGVCDGNQAGSSDPTFYGNNHRVVATSGGRMVAVYDAHGSAQQLVWRNASGGAWQTQTTGSVPDGYLPENAPNDRPASLALVRDEGGAEHAWLVWAGYEASSENTKLTDLAVRIRRLTNLDASSGPSVGEPVEVAPAGMGNLRPDIAFQDGRVHIAWVRHTSSGYDLMTTSSSTLDVAEPVFAAPSVLASGADPSTTATFVTTADGLRLVARGSRLELFRYGSSGWSPGDAAFGASRAAMPSAVALDSGDILAAVHDGDGVEVIRFGNDGDSGTVEKTFAGYRQPSIASDGRGAVLVMIRAQDGYLVSRERDPGSGWSTQDRKEIGSEGGRLGWPNLVRDIDDRIRLIVAGGDCKNTNRNWVLAYQRSLAEPPRMSISDVRVTEGDAGTTQAVFTVSLSDAATASVGARYITAEGTATAPSDFVPAEGEIELAPGDTTAKVTVLVNGDTVREPDETFSVTLSDPSGATIGDSRGAGTILDDDDGGDPRSTRTTLDLRRRPARVRAFGTVAPSIAGQRMVVKLATKRDGVFVVRATKRPLLSKVAGRNISSYRTRFWRPKKGRCRITAKYPGDEANRPSWARRTWRC